MDEKKAIDNEDKVILRQILEITKDNQEKIHRLYRGLWISRIWRVAYWIIVIGIAVGGFYFIQPYIDELKSAYSGFQEQLNVVKGAFQ